jgi:hypothetical protein
MFKWVYDKTTGEYLEGGPYEPAFNPATQGVAVLQRHPNRRTERHDPELGIRPAAAEEIAEYDGARRDERALSDADQKALKAAVLLIRQYCNALLAGAYTQKSLADVRADYLTIWKALP